MVFAPLHLEVCAVFSSEMFSTDGAVSFNEDDMFAPPLRIRRRFVPIGPGKLILAGEGKSTVLAMDEESIVKEKLSTLHRNCNEID